MAKSLEQWKQQVLNGQPIDLDNASYDCVDVSKHWVEYLTGVGWQTSTGWGNAKDIYDFWKGTYLHKMPAGTAPQLGDICVMNGTVGGGYGHTGVVIGIQGNNITIVQQNTFTQQKPYTGIWNGYGSYIKYLRPKTAFDVGLAPALRGDQRIAAYAAKYRTAPNAGAPLMKTNGLPDGLMTGGETYDFKGYVVGENVDNNPNWLVGAHTGGYVWSGAMTDTGIHDLPNITPATLKGNQRQVAGDVMNVRREAVLAPGNVITTLEAGKVYTFNGWIVGANVENNSTWFRLDTGGFVHSSGFTDKGTHDLPEIAVVVAPVEPPKPPVFTPMFEKELACVTQVVPAHPTNYQTDNFPVKPTGVVLHDFGTDGRDTLGSSLNHFANPDTTAPHLTISGKNIIQNGKLAWRMYHAGPKGNHLFGIEIDPDVDTNPETQASVNLALKALDLYVGKPLTRHKHPEFSATACGDEVDLAKFQPISTPPVVVPDPSVPPVTPPITPPNPPNPDQNLTPSFIRTLVPYIIGGLVSFLATKGLNISTEAQTEVIAVLTVVLGQAYYIAVRWLETRIDPKLGILLGKAKAPIYHVEPK